MCEIFFYHLTQSRLEDTLPKLIERSLQRKWRVAVLCGTEGFCAALDTLLWGGAEASFIPHGTEKDLYPQEQPVLLSLDLKNLNKADVCFCTEGVIAPNPQDYQRVCIMFDGNNPEQLAAARAAWKNLKAEQQDGESLYALTYWQQSPQRKWEKKA